MATTYSIKYKNHCTPQEQISSGGRYYLDSDCGRKLTGRASITPTSTSYTATDTVSSSDIVTVADNQDFVYIKNLGGGNGDDVVISLNGSPTSGSAEYSIKLSSGEAISLELRHDDNVLDTEVLVKCANSGEDSTIEYFTGSLP